jgi:hypothetical protein
MQQGVHQLVPVKEILLDKSNPRIQQWLEMYPGDPTPAQIHQALGAGMDDSEGMGGTKYSTLKNSIQTNGGIIQPVIININSHGQKVCVEGNTRVCLYKSFLEQKVSGKWDKIPAIVYANLDEESIDAIRLQAHLVGPRQWDPYSKAKYLTYLRNREKFPFSKLVDYCGGSQKAVQESIDAFADMEEHYRPLCGSEADFDPRRFSGFVELQKNNVKTAILQAGFTLGDFSSWIFDRRIDPLNTVRYLPKILKNKKAINVFLKKGATEAIKTLERPDLSKALQEASIGQLSQALSEAINKIPYTHFEEIKKDSGSDTFQALVEAQDKLNAFMASLQS